MVIRSVIKPSAYFDSVTLMLVQRDVRQLPGIEEAGAVMGTDANKELLRDAGLLTPEAEAARPDDLILAVRATSDEAAVAAVTAAETLLTQRRGGGLARDRHRRARPEPGGGRSHGAGGDSGAGLRSRDRGDCAHLQASVTRGGRAAAGCRQARAQAGRDQLRRGIGGWRGFPARRTDVGRGGPHGGDTRDGTASTLAPVGGAAGTGGRPARSHPEVCAGVIQWRYAVL